MSSATSIEKKSIRIEPDDADPQADAGFRPWHFFVLASLMMATVAVVMSRQSTPEHLILISFTIAAAGAAAAGFYRMLAPLATDDVSLFSEPLTERSRMALEREKALVMRSIKELEFDRAMGKLSPKDFDEMAGRLRTRAIMLMKQLDEGGSVYRELIERELTSRLADARSRQAAGDRSGHAVAAATQAVLRGSCASCGTSNDDDAAFCKRCGSKLHEVPLDVARGRRS